MVQKNRIAGPDRERGQSYHQEPRSSITVLRDGFIPRKTGRDPDWLDGSWRVFIRGVSIDNVSLRR